jgi:hypothetical protein
MTRQSRLRLLRATKCELLSIAYPGMHSNMVCMTATRCRRAGATSEPRINLSLQNTPIDLRSLKLIDFHLPCWSAQQRLFIVLGALTSMLKTSAQLRLENLALRQQLTVLRRSAPKRLSLTPADRIFWVWLLRVWSDWRSV